MKVYLYIVLLFLVACASKPDLPDAFQAGWKGESVAEIVHEDDNIRILRCTFPPGVGHEKHYHEPHIGYTLKGSTFKITDKEGTRTVKVPTGTTFHKDDIYIHEVVNIGDSTAVFLIIEPK
ncbi:MAG: cupin domain-containing protein [Gelidibacter sp.]